MNPSTKLHRLFIAIASMAMAASSQAQSFSENFNGLTAGNNLQATTPQDNWYASATSFNVEAGTGLNSSNSINTLSANDRTALWDVTSFDLGNKPISASVYFNVTSTGGSIYLLLSGVNNSTTNRNGIQVQFGASNLTWGHLVDGAGTTGSTIGAYTVGNWYYLTATFSQNAGKLDIAGSVFNSTSAGVVGTQVGSSYSALALTSTSLIGDTTIYGGFRSSFVGKTDDVAFTAIPEPSSFAALAGMATLGFVAARRRRV
jgi:PEP-CTERM motif